MWTQRHLKGEKLRPNFWQGKVQNSSPISALLRWRHFRLSLSVSLSLSLSLSHRAHLTHNMGSASALPKISISIFLFRRCCKRVIEVVVKIITKWEFGTGWCPAVGASEMITFTPLSREKRENRTSTIKQNFRWATRAKRTSPIQLVVWLSDTSLLNTFLSIVQRKNSYVHRLTVIKAIWASKMCKLTYDHSCFIIMVSGAQRETKTSFEQPVPSHEPLQHMAWFSDACLSIKRVGKRVKHTASDPETSFPWFLSCSLVWHHQGWRLLPSCFSWRSPSKLPRPPSHRPASWLHLAQLFWPLRAPSEASRLSLLGSGDTRAYRRNFPERNKLGRKMSVPRAPTWPQPAKLPRGFGIRFLPLRFCTN